MGSLAELDGDDMKRLLFMKFKAWEYEAEYRAFCRLEEQDPASGLYFQAFSDDFKLVQVIIGERSEATRSQLMASLGSGAAAITSFKARAGFQKFEVVRNRSKDAWQ